MPQLFTHSPDNPDFPRVVTTARLEGLGEFVFDIGPTEAEAGALARLLGARSVRKLRLRGRLLPLAGAGWALEAQLGATVVQTCVVSLDPVTTRVDQPVRRRFLPLAAPGPELDIAPDDEDEVEPLGESIDLGLVAAEALALALPDYPRKGGVSLGDATFAAEGVQPLRGAEVKPFASLAALRDKMGQRS